MIFFIVHFFIILGFLQPVFNDTIINYDFVTKVKKLKIKIIKGDIIHMKVDAIVNAANSSLCGWYF
jgi:hypothetical protein